MPSGAVSSRGVDDPGSSKPRTRRVLHVEDDTFVRRAFAFSFSELRLDGVSTIADARERMETERYFAWVVDVHLPDGCGLDLLEWSRRRGLHTPAIVVTADDRPDVVRRAQLLGVEIAFKPDLRANVHAFFDRVKNARAVIPAVRYSVDRFAVDHRLSERERELVRAIARGVSRGELDATLGVTENTVKTLIRRILRKTTLNSIDDVLRAILSSREEPLTR